MVCTSFSGLVLHTCFGKTTTHGSFMLKPPVPEATKSRESHISSKALTPPLQPMNGKPCCFFSPYLELSTLNRNFAWTFIRPVQNRPSVLQVRADFLTALPWSWARSYSNVRKMSPLHSMCDLAVLTARSLSLVNNLHFISEE